MRDDRAAAAAVAAVDAPAPPDANALLKQIEVLREDLATANVELNVLRRRDDTIKYYMHRIDEELRLAARLQQDFLPRALPQLGRVHFHTLFRPAGYVSGDLYDVMRLDERHVGFYMCDAVGHGMPAALLTMFMKQALITKEIIPGQGYRLLTPGETMGKLNDALVEQNLSQATFATAIYGVVDVEALRVTFARGGHPIPVLLRDGNEPPASMEVEGSLLGIFPNEVFAEASIDLKTGDKLFIYSDGVEVAFTEGEVADEMRWRHEIEQRRALTGEQLLVDFSNHLDAQSGSLQPKDDLTMIMIEVQ